MQLSVVSCHIKGKEIYSLLIRFGDELFLEEIIIKKEVVVYFEYSEKMQHILHKNVSEAKVLNKVIFDMYKGEKIEFPFYVGDF